MPASQSESIQIQKCYPGFLAWNKHWIQSFSNAKEQNPGLNALTNVHIYYEEWAKTLMESKNHLEFQRLWELVMIRSSSEAMCETVGSIMGQHCAKSCYVDPDNFSKISI